MVMMLPGPEFEESQGGLWKVLQALELYNSIMGSQPPKDVTGGTKLEGILNRESGAFERRMIPQTGGAMGQGMGLLKMLNIFLRLRGM